MQPSARQTSQGVLVTPLLRDAQRSTSCGQPWEHQGAPATSQGEQITQLQHEEVYTNGSYKYAN